MKELEFNQEMMDSATKWSEDTLGKFIKKNTIMKGINASAGAFAGRLGEIALSKYFDVGIEDKKDYDLIVDGKKLEVKTKQRAVKPRPDYIVQVASTSRHQQPDSYAFLTLEYEDRNSGGVYLKPKRLWLCGFKSAKDYFEQAELWPKGYVDPKMPSYVTKRDMYVMAIEDLDDRL